MAKQRPRLWYKGGGVWAGIGETEYNIMDEETRQKQLKEIEEADKDPIFVERKKKQFKPDIDISKIITFNKPQGGK